MKKGLLSLLIMAFLVSSVPAFAVATEGHPGKVNGRTVAAGAASLIIWPGIGQVINDNPKDKNVCHALLGLTGIFRIWSCYDAFVDRKGGVWHNRI